MKTSVLGVINITPDSFSDGGINLDANSLNNSISTFSTNQIFSIDVGAQSTAPFNQSISIEEEVKRFNQYFLKIVDWKLLENVQFISIDTYYPEVIRYLIPVILANGFLEDQIIWNDISGKLDEAAILVLREFPSIRYVLSHNLCPDRLSSNKHMDFVDYELDLCSVEGFFQNGLDALCSNDIELERIILDPCFGFSKTQEQNFMLIKNLHKIKNIHPHWLLGVSRKSFLQSLCISENKEEKIKESEFFHQFVLTAFMQQFHDNELFLRVHDVSVFDRAKICTELL